MQVCINSNEKRVHLDYIKESHANGDFEQILPIKEVEKLAFQALEKVGGKVLEQD